MRLKITQIRKSTQLNAYNPTYEEMMGKEPPMPRAGDFGSIERRARKPTKGIRLRFRTMLRQMGVTGKFRTDELRNGTLMILGAGQRIEAPIATFEGRNVRSDIR